MAGRGGEENPRVQEWRLSVLSFLEGHDRDVMEAMLDQHVRDSQCSSRGGKDWGKDVTREILDSVGMGMDSAYWDFVGSSDAITDEVAVDQMAVLPARVEDNDADSILDVPSPPPSLDKPYRLLGMQTPSHALPTPPMSPEERSANSSDLPSPSLEPLISTPPTRKTDSLFCRLSRATSKLRNRTVSLRPTPRLNPPPPSPPTLVSKSSFDDLRTLRHGPTLKINRLSGISIPLSPEEREQMARRRAHGSKTDEFDVVIRLGTQRTPRASTYSTVRGSTHEGVVEDILEALSRQFPDRATETRPVPHIDKLFRQSTTPSVNSASSRKVNVAPRRPSRLKSRRENIAHLRKEEEKYRRPAEYTARSSLSEANLKKLAATTKTPVIPRRRSSIRTKSKRQATPQSQPATFHQESVVILPSPKKRVLRKQPPRLDNLPIVYTTELGLKGGKIGAVQTGSPAKANKILGDEVLRVPDPEIVQIWREFPLPPSAFRDDRLVEGVFRYSRDSSIWTRTESEGAVWVV